MRNHWLPRRRRRSPFGVTLIELLVVIVIAAILMAIVFATVHEALKMVNSFRGGRGP